MPRNSDGRLASGEGKKVMAKITAKVRCHSRVSIGEDVSIVQFGADYYGDDAEINAAWSRYTPALAIQMNVIQSVPFVPGKSYTLTFDDGEA